MSKLKAYLSRHRVTLMVIPSTEKSIKQWKLNIAIAFFILILLITINIALLINTISSKATSQSLFSKNTTLSDSLLMTQDRLLLLENINANKTEEIKTLKDSLKESNNYLVERLDDLEKAETYVADLVTLFNSETNSNIEAPISRSYNRLQTSENANADGTFIETDELLLSQMDALVATDEITAIIQEKTLAYEALSKKMDKQLNYLDSRPDFYPTSGTFSSPFGYRRDPKNGRLTMHNGIDISNKVGTPIYAAGTGVVTFAGYDGNFGNVLIINHGYGYESVYAHCKTLLYQPGDSIAKGQKIATIGTSGRVTGPHLHFEIRYNQTPINPLKFIQ